MKKNLFNAEMAKTNVRNFENKAIANAISKAERYIEKEVLSLIKTKSLQGATHLNYSFPTTLDMFEIIRTLKSLGFKTKEYTNTYIGIFWEE